MKRGLIASAEVSVTFAAASVLIVFAMVALSYAIEKYAKRKNGDKERILTTRKMVMIGMFSGISGILFCFDIALPIAPAFYKLDISELPALIGGFAFGPVAGILIEFFKVVVKLLIKSTSTAFVGELANFLIGSMMVLPASAIYLFHKGKKAAVIGCIAGTLTMTIFGTIFNALFLLPAFASLYGMPLEAILEMGTAINENVNGIWSFVLLMVAPMNLIKGTLVSVLTMLLYKRLTPIIRFGRS